MHTLSGVPGRTGSARPARAVGMVDIVRAMRYIATSQYSIDPPEAMTSTITRMRRAVSMLRGRGGG